MIKNCLTLLLVLVLVGCRSGKPEPRRFQGVVEFDERVLGFEVGGRIRSVNVQRGMHVEQAQQVAVLDAKLETALRAAREGEAKAAEEQVALLRAGTRPEEIRSLAAQIRAGEATEDLLKKNLDRERTLLAQGVSTQSAVDELESRLQAAEANRQSLVQKLVALKKGPRSQEIASAEARAEAARETVALETERLALHELKAPLSSTVLDVHVEPGEVVAAGTAVVTLGDTRHPYADVFVPQGELAGVAVGVPVEALVDSHDEPFHGSVEQIWRRTEFTPRFLFSERERPNLVVRVRVRLEDPKDRLHAGVPTRVVIGTTAANRAAEARR